MEEKNYKDELEFINAQILGETPKKQSIFKKFKIGSIISMLCFGLICGGSGAYVGASIYKNTMPTNQSPTGMQVSGYIPTANSSNNNTYSYAEVSAMVKNTVVEIVTETVTTNPYFGQYVSGGAGSGVVISQDGYIVTNNHVIADANKITVRTTDGTEYSAKLIGTDKQSDVAVIKIEATGLQAATFGNSDSLVAGEEVLAIGNPLGELGGSVSQGIISAKDREINVENVIMTLLQTTAAVNPGNSGGGLFNMKGELIGIVNAKNSGSDIEGIGFAIPSNSAQTVISDIMLYGYVKGRPILGIQAIEISNSSVAMQYSVNTLGIYVHSTTTADSALKAGDVITEIDGTNVSTLASVSALLSKHKAGDVISIKLVRDSKTITVNHKLIENIPTTD